MSNKWAKPMPKMKACPFCGHEAATTFGMMGKIVFVICKNYKSCGATVSFDCNEANGKGERKTIEMWNKRVIE